MLKQKTVYIREEDLEAWESLPNKAQFIHDALGGKTLPPAVSKSTRTFETFTPPPVVWHKNPLYRDKKKGKL